MTNFITDFNLWRLRLLSLLQSAGIDYATIELKMGASYSKDASKDVQVSVYITPTQHVTGFDPEDVIREVERRINFSRSQEALRLAPPDAEFEVVPSAPPSQAPDDDIPF